MDSAPSNPRAALDSIWRDLYSRFGTPLKISSELHCKIASFPPIKNCGDISKLRELNRLCRSIALNMSTTRDLDSFNTTSGMSKVLRLLPAKVFER